MNIPRTIWNNLYIPAYSVHNTVRARTPTFLHASEAVIMGTPTRTCSSTPLTKLTGLVLLPNVWQDLILEFGAGRNCVLSFTGALTEGGSECVAVF